MDGKPDPAARGDFHGYLGRIIPSERDLLETAIFPPHDATVGEARVIEWQTDASLRLISIAQPAILRTVGMIERASYGRSGITAAIIDTLHD